MIPSVVARQTRETVLDYLRTTFAFRDPDFEERLFRFLEREDGIFRGPFLDIRLPFRKSAGDRDVPLEIRPDFAPYLHQLGAFQRLHASNGHVPEHTLVTTGTGSGKTECFLYPVLDHCWRTRSEPGIKAIIFYPMNALASDQARRLAETLHQDERLRDVVAAGLYVGGEGTHGSTTHEHLVDMRNVLRQSPPNILLTNYKMLDYLLLRPEDRALWKRNGPDTLRYLVLDELHTYDGAQGSDVACLIRRLKNRLGATPGSITCVGTSATIGGGEATELGREGEALTRFASEVFDEEFPPESVITEERMTFAEVLPDSDPSLPVPAPGPGVVREYRPGDEGGAERWLEEQARLWLGNDGLPDREALGRALAPHPFLRELLRIVAGGPSSYPMIDEALADRLETWGGGTLEERHGLLDSFLALVSHARGEKGRAFLTVQLQVWMREIRRLVRKVVPGDSVFAWGDEVGAGGSRTRGEHWLPIAYCRECGADGAAAYHVDGQPFLRDDPRGIGEAWLQRSSDARFLDWEREAGTMTPQRICPHCLRPLATDVCNCSDHDGPDEARIGPFPVVIGRDTSERGNFLAKCPSCESNGALRMLGSRAATMLSVAISRLFVSDFTTEVKLIAFTDSVQDASHRAGFFGARSHRFNFRTATQTLLREQGDVPLSELGPRLLAFWSERGSPKEAVVTLLPRDLRELESWVEHRESKRNAPSPRLRRDLSTRLTWEGILEYGHNSRIGRSLEKSICSTVAVDREAFARAAEIVSLELGEGSLAVYFAETSLSEDAVRHFLRGLLFRLRTRGGVHHELLRGFVRSYGKSYPHLTKSHNPLMSPFGPESVLPRFWVDRRPRAGETGFDCFVSASNRVTWYRDWAERCLGVDRSQEGLNALVREAIDRFERAGILIYEDLPRGARAWGLNPDSLVATRDVRALRCPECRSDYAVPADEAGEWEGARCPQFRCPGTIVATGDAKETYYSRVYRSGRLARLFSEEHTGLLSRPERERIEDEFKHSTEPGATNLLVATPTLEMGIDIGDLSAVVLCSVPPTTSNYLQRIGRAGRNTGNALCVTMAVARPHDLYFYTDPYEMIDGEVLPPGCFLNAPEMLKRQFVAHAMDRWAAESDDDHVLPGQIRQALGKQGRERFPGAFLSYLEEHRDGILESFLRRFPDLTEENRERLTAFAIGGDVPELMNGAFDRVLEERDEYQRIIRAARDRVREIEEDPEAFENPEVEKRDARQTIYQLERVRGELLDKYPLNVLTDAGVLPNYGFPEPGVTLRSVISSGDGEDRRTSHYEYQRPASAALREFAPFNTFYAEGRRVRIDQIDIGRRMNPKVETWRLCPSCHRAERIFETDRKPERECPACRDASWPDTGQLFRLVSFRRAESFTSSAEAASVDDSDSRIQSYYQTLDVIDVRRENYMGARVIEELPFGFELLKDLPLREINFGWSGTGAGNRRVSGETVPDEGFLVCNDCHRVRAPESDRIEHAPHCRARRNAQDERAESIFLYREITSEAIRILMPFADLEVEERRASFRAALALGLRRKFRGDPGHLQTRFMREKAESSHRNYLVLFDAVPGGTGYLSELMQQDQLIDVLQEALDAIRSCVCRQGDEEGSEPRNGCYRCLFAYQSQRDLPHVSSTLAEGMLREILAKRDALADADTVGELDVASRVESELEVRFLKALRSWIEGEDGGKWERSLHRGADRYHLSIGDTRWRIDPQVWIGESDGVSRPTRADFVFRCTSRPDARPVAVYTDGAEYHVCPGQARGRVADDAGIRRALVLSGNFWTWSLTWQDIADDSSHGSVSDARYLGDCPGARARSIWPEESPVPGGIHALDSLALFKQHLRTPGDESWTGAAAATVVAWIGADATADPGEARKRSEALLEKMDPGPAILSAVPPDKVADGTHLARARKHAFGELIGIVATDSVRRGANEDARLVLRLFDERAHREREEFVDEWRVQLRTWNLMQFLPDMDWTTTERITSGAPFEAEEPSPSEEVEGGWEECLKLAQDRERPLLDRLREAGVSPPTLGIELGEEAVVAEADLGWESREIAWFSDPDAPDRKQFEARGWRVFAGDGDTERLIEAMKDGD